MEATVASLRADAVLGAMLHTSRSLAAAAIAAGKVELNHLPLRSAHEPVFAGDLFTVRGAGRWRVKAIGGKSRKRPHLYHLLSVLTAFDCLWRNAGAEQEE